jgi:RNA polymerase sigma factor (sigma-70 family)
MAFGQLNKVIHHIRTVFKKQDATGVLDADLLRRYVQQRDQAAFEILVRRHGPMVMGVCLRVLHNSHDAEDAFQATFLVLLRKASGLRSPGMIGNWLYGVAYRTALHARDAAAKRRAKEIEMTTRTEAAEDPWADLRHVLDRELDRLPDKYRAVIVLCDLEGKTRKEAALHLGWAEGTVASRLGRGRALLAKRLAHHGLALSGGALAVALSQNASACVSSSVLSSTIKASSLLAAGQAAAGVGSIKVAALTEGVLKTMLTNKLKVVIPIVLILGFMATAATVLTYRTAAAQGDKPPIAGERVGVAREQEKEPITDTLKMKLVLIPAGKFTMGSPASEKGRYDNEVQHEVEIKEPFYLGIHEVRVRDFRAFVEDAGYKTEGEKAGDKVTWKAAMPDQTQDHPVSKVSWNDAQAFCEWLSKKEGKNYRLPTEAEWEYACRAGTKTRYSFGDDFETLKEAANVASSFTMPVGKFKANAFGLYDMHGNVYEWCQDLYEKGSTNRIHRGGGYGFCDNSEKHCRSAFRGAYTPSSGHDWLGFRVARDAEGGQLRTSEGENATVKKTPDASKRPTTATELAKFEGTWVLISSERDGRVSSEEKNPYTLTFAGNKWKVHRGDEVAVKGTLRLVDVAATPKKFDLVKTLRLTATTSVDYGIYEWDGDTLRYCTRNGPLEFGPGVADLRPRDFTTHDGDGRAIYLWKRIQARESKEVGKE